MASSSSHGAPGNRQICRTRYCWIRQRSFLSSLGSCNLLLAALNSRTKAKWAEFYSLVLYRRPYCCRQHCSLCRLFSVCPDCLSWAWRTFEVEHFEVGPILVGVLKHRTIIKFYRINNKVTTDSALISDGCPLSKANTILCVFGVAVNEEKGRRKEKRMEGMI